jgi:preprotein translocase subunit SecD
MLAGNTFADIPKGADIEKLVEDSQLPIIIYSPDGNSDALDENVLSAALLKTKQAIVSPDIPDSVVTLLSSRGFEVAKGEARKNTPWLWSVTNAKQIISLTEEVTNEDVADVSKAEIFTTLSIRGIRTDAETARTDLEELTILLESGSLPTPVKSISKETISPSLGESFLNEIILMGAVALVAVAAFIVFRYRNLLLAAPIFGTVLAETVILLGFLSFTRNPLDLAAFAGLIAALGSGVNSEVVITDEIITKSEAAQESLLQRVKSALFIITTSMITIVGVMGPIVLFSRSFPGLEKLYGYALVAIFGSIAGVLFTRPAFTRIVEKVVEMSEKKASV